MYISATDAWGGCCSHFKTFFVNSGWWHPKKIYLKDFFKEFIQNFFFATKSIQELYSLTRGLCLSHVEIFYPVFFLLLSLLPGAANGHPK
jgi:hypothetical protein